AVTLPLRNQADLRALIAKVSDPASPEYGHYLTPAQFAARFAPTGAQVQAVASFLRAQGIDVGHVSTNNTVVDATATVAQAEKAFGVTIGRYHDPRLGRDYVANDAAVTVPSTVAPDVVGVIGLDTHFRRQHPPLPKA